MSLYLLERNDGGVSVMQILDKNTTPEEEVGKLTPDIRDQIIGISLIAPTDIPSDLTFRDAWTAQNGKAVVDMARARAIHRDRLRMLRAPKLAALDVAYLKAQEKGDAAAMADIVAKKQALRDAPAHPAIDAATTPEQLAAAVPAVLTAP